MTPGEVRAHVAARLAEIDPDVPVHDGPVDSLAPPCFMLVWGADPWLVPSTMCTYMAALHVVCVGARVEPLPGYQQIEQLVMGALAVLEDGGIVDVARPSAYEHGGLQYQAARITVRYPITTEEVTNG